MKTNPTTQRFPRALRDDPSRSIDSFSGPYRRGSFKFHKLLTAVTLLCAVAGTLAMITGALQQ